MRRLILLVFAACVACAGGGTATAPPDSGIEGLVLIGPTCPVVVQGQDCDDKPYSGEVQVVDRATGKLVATARSGADGRFRLALAPGNYTLEPVPPNAGGLPSGKPLDVTVRPHTYEQVTVSFDSGIR